MVFADSLVPNRRQAICEHRADWTVMIVAVGSLGYWTLYNNFKCYCMLPYCVYITDYTCPSRWAIHISDSHWLDRIDMAACLVIYRKISNISCTLVGNKIVDHSDVVGASPVGAAPTKSSFSTEHLASRYSTKTATRRYEYLLSVGIWCILY